eukprot:439951-Rhodomonas_salina.3
MSSCLSRPSQHRRDGDVPSARVSAAELLCARESPRHCRLDCCCQVQVILVQPGLPHPVPVQGGVEEESECV